MEVVDINQAVIIYWPWNESNTEWHRSEWVDMSLAEHKMESNLALKLILCKNGSDSTLVGSVEHIDAPSRTLNAVDILSSPQLWLPMRHAPEIDILKQRRVDDQPNALKVN